MSNTSNTNTLVETMNNALQAAGLGQLIGMSPEGILTEMCHSNTNGRHACTDSEVPAWEVAWDAAKAAADEEAAMLD